MSIIMPGKMPDRCTSCVFCDDYFDDGDFGLCCSISGSRIYGRERLKDCPVIQLPPHGRLIDADALIADLKRQCREVFRVDAVSPDDFWITRIEAYSERLWGTWCESFFDYLQTRPTIIPADPDGGADG